MNYASVADDKLPTIARERFERVYNVIRNRICLLEYEPGARLGEEELAREFGVSRTPIRRVLSRLESEGLLESRHGVGTFVTTVDFDSLMQVYQLRMELAVLIGRLDPIPRSEDDLNRVRAILKKCDDMVPAPDSKAIALINVEFFHELAAMIGNQPLKEISERLYYLTHRIWLTSVPSLNLADEIIVFRRELADILAAMEIGDLEAVGHIRRSHISMSVKRMQKISGKDP
jgi:DNA-binding GntR family transcriptional regulator